MNKILDWFAEHTIFIYGTLAFSELLYLLEQHLRKDRQD